MIRGIWSRETVGFMLVAAQLPIAVIWIWFEGAHALERLGLAFLAVLIWHLVFLLVRAQPPSIAALSTALAIAMLAPEDLGFFRFVLGVSFGVVMGELVFGGWGRNVVNPATVTLSFLGFGFPMFAWPVFDIPVAWAVLPALLIGIFTGAMSGALAGGAVLVAAGAMALGVLPTEVVAMAAIVFVLVVADPVTSAATTGGRWLNGALYAGLVILFATNWSGASEVQMAVAAALLASLAAPLLDEMAVAIWVAHRRRRHGRT